MAKLKCFFLAGFVLVIVALFVANIAAYSSDSFKFLRNNVAVILANKGIVKRGNYSVFYTGGGISFADTVGYNILLTDFKEFVWLDTEVVKEPECVISYIAVSGENGSYNEVYRLNQ